MVKVGKETLSVGDRIRIVRKPNDWGTMHRETKMLFNRLIKRARSLRIAEVRTNPGAVKEAWINCRFREKSRWHYHSLAILDDGSWIKVRKRFDSGEL